MFKIEEMLAYPTQIEKYLFLSSVDCLENDAFFATTNVTHILSIMKNPPAISSKHKNVKQMVISIDDSPEVNILDHFEAARDFIYEAKNNNSDILIHCEKGISRSASIVIAYLLYEQHRQGLSVSYANTLKKLTNARSCVWPNSGFTRQLRIFADMLNKTLLSSKFPELTESDYHFFAEQKWGLEDVYKISITLRSRGFRKIDLALLIGFSGQASMASLLLTNSGDKRESIKNLLIGAVHNSQLDFIKEINPSIEDVSPEVLTHATANNNNLILNFFDNMHPQLNWNFPTPQGGNLLFIAAYYGCYDVFKFLLTKKNLNATQCDTANGNILQSLAFTQNPNLIKFVRDSLPTISPYSNNNLGISAFDRARRNNNTAFLAAYQNWRQETQVPSKKKYFI